MNFNTFFLSSYISTVQICVNNCYNHLLHGKCNSNGVVCSCFPGYFDQDCGKSALDLAPTAWNAFWIFTLFLYTVAAMFFVYNLWCIRFKPNESTDTEERHYIKLVSLELWDNIICLAICVDTILYCILDPGGFRQLNIFIPVRIRFEFLPYISFVLMI